MGDGKENKGGERDRDEEWVDGDGEMLLDGKGGYREGGRDGDRDGDRNREFPNGPNSKFLQHNWIFLTP